MGKLIQMSDYRPLQIDRWIITHLKSESWQRFRDPAMPQIALSDLQVDSTHPPDPKGAA